MIHKCNKCEYRSPYKANYRRHLRNKHEEPKMIHYCAHCDYQTPYTPSIISHMNTAHSAQQKKLQCYCTSNYDYSIKRNYSKDGFRVSHHEQKYFCPFCNFRTHKKYNLEMHKKNKHGTSQRGSEALLEEQIVSHHTQQEILHQNKHSIYKEGAPTNTLLQPEVAYSSTEIPDECGIRRNAGDEVKTLINESFDVFQHYMKIKMQANEVGYEDMIEKSIDVFKCYMLEKLMNKCLKL